jgi:gliding motility-associated-like protein
MKQFFAFISLLLLCFFAKGSHITGGEMFYQLISVQSGVYKYKVNMKLFMRCNSGRQFNNPAIVSIFSKTGARIKDVSVPLQVQENISLANNNKCITNPPVVCYDVGYYVFEVDLPASASGYILSCQVVFRIAGISNLTPGYGNIGATYTAEIPGTATIASGPNNNSAYFIGNDLVVICAQNAFTYSFAAVDPDGDQLRYSFAPAYQGGSNGGNNSGSPSTPPPFESVPYGTNYPSSAPLGLKAKIDPVTGLIKGTAPVPGIYVVTVQVEEIRNGVVIAIQRKDLQIHITNCSIAAASIDEEIMLCRNTQTISLENASTSPLINSYLWQFYNSAGQEVFSSTTPKVTYNFPDTGIYNIKLIINKGQDCSDSAVSKAFVYPGFFPAFKFSGTCINKPTQFTDLTTTKYGNVDTWEWDFGDAFVANSTLKDPTYTYSSYGAKNVTLNVTNSVGCKDTAVRVITMTDKPELDLAFKDTLICDKDAVQLIANATGNYTWTPNYNISASNTSSPKVQPKATTKYYASLDQDGCIGADSVLVRVTDHVDLSAMPDSTICETDSVQLRIQSNGFDYSWSPSTFLNDANAKQPISTPSNMITYNVISAIGSCTASANIKITTAPYPIAVAGKDTTICFNSSAQLKGQMEGNTFAWSPSNSITSPNGLTSFARPVNSTDYVLTVFSQNGCPKPHRDTVVVTVLPDIKAFAGNDTSVIIGQQLQLNGTGGTSFVWSPSNYLNAANIPNPIATFNAASDKIILRLISENTAGCKDSAYINIKVFSTIPEVFVPTAFTPNKDGRNDELKPIAVGMKQIEKFTVFNRWGQIVFTTSSTERGWDGNVNGKPQGTGTFAWMVSATDHTGKPYSKKGTVVLIR